MLSSRRATATAVPAWWDNPSPKTTAEASASATPWGRDLVPEPAETPENSVPADGAERRPDQIEATAPTGDGWSDWTDWAVEPDRAGRGGFAAEAAPAPVQTAPLPAAPRRPAPPATPPPAAECVRSEAPEAVGGEIVLARRVGWAEPANTGGGDLPWPPRSAKRPRGKRWRRSKGRATTTPRKPLLSLARSLDSWEPISITEACGFAVRFAADYLSWDEDEPQRRPAALRNYLADPNQAHLGWTGAGRQRADLVIPGRTVTLSDGAVIVVEITARTVLYQRTTAASAWSPADPAAGTVEDDDWLPPGETTPSLAFAPASAPPPVAPGWAAGAGWWVQIAVPVRRDRDGRVVVDLELDPTALNDH